MGLLAKIFAIGLGVTALSIIVLVALTSIPKDGYDEDNDYCNDHYEDEYDE